MVNIGSQSDFFVAKFATSPCSPLSNEEFNFLKSKVYPNPAREILNILADEPSSFAIFNLSGQMIKKGLLLSGENSVEIKGISSGIYLLTVENSRTENFKLIVQ